MKVILMVLAASHFNEDEMKSHAVKIIKTHGDFCKFFERSLVNAPPISKGTSHTDWLKLAFFKGLTADLGRRIAFFVSDPRRETLKIRGKVIGEIIISPPSRSRNMVLDFAFTASSIKPEGWFDPRNSCLVKEEHEAAVRRAWEIARFWLVRFVEVDIDPNSFDVARNNHFRHLAAYSRLHQDRYKSRAEIHVIKCRNPELVKCWASDFRKKFADAGFSFQSLFLDKSKGFYVVIGTQILDG
jgi:hypothetical protein